ncbi:MAG: hypothetical protein J6T51_03340 [Kiritimatiellae bacterium]|nr:hypothetical protein [Kiritimatiellia bacterium]
MPVASTATETVTPVKVPGKSDIAQLYRASWIWHPVDSKAAGKVKFRAALDAQKAAEATLVFSCDNAAVVFVNGARVAEQKCTVRSPYDGWEKPTKAKVALKAGRNEIVVDAENPIPGEAGLVASFVWEGGVFATNGNDWEVKREGEEFVRAKRIAGFGSGVWKTLGSKEQITCSPFAESVATTLSFTMPEFKKGERVYFVCDGTEGENSAAATVNGAYAGGFIGAPYRLDITKSVKSGSNTLEAKPFRLKNPRIVIVSVKEFRRREAHHGGECLTPLVE